MGENRSLNYPVLTIVFYEYDKKSITKNFRPEIELTEQEKEDLIIKTIKYLQKEVIKLKRRTMVPKRKGN